MNVSAEQIGAVELRIPAKATWVAVARLVVSAVANQLPFSLEAIEDLKLALTEACTKCIEHAAGEDETIDIAFTVMPDVVRIVVRARHQGRDARSVNLVTSQKSGDRTEGLGIYIIQSLMDSVEYRVDEHAGTELVMLKFVPSQ
jgi:serine/threonine-protein kinase RsbW